MSNKPVVAFKNVSKLFELHQNVSSAFWANLPVFNRFRRASKTPREIKSALKDVSFSIYPGEKVGIIGRNGSGKTTLLRLVIGQTDPSSGTITMNGNSQALMQTGFGFSPELTGIENIRNSLLYNGLDPSEHNAFIDDIIDFVELGDFINYPIKTYSLGMHARLEFATATAIRPDILVVDEVMGAGDGYFARKSAERMRNLVEKSTLLLVSHSLAQINEFCDRVLWINDGALMADGEAQEVIERYEDFMAGYNAERDVAVAQKSELSADSVAKEDADELFPNSEAVVSKFQAMIEAETNALQSGLQVRFSPSKKVQYTVCQVGGHLRLPMEAELAKAAQPLKVQPCVWGFSALGSYLFNAKGPVQTLSGGDTRSFVLQKQDLNVGIGEYLLFFGLLCPETDRLLAVAQESGKLRVPPTNYSDPPLIHLEGQWQFDNRPPEAARIDAWI